MDILFVSHIPPSPATFGAQRRIEGLMGALASRHRITGVSLVGGDFDPAAAERAMRAYCEEVTLVPARPERGLEKRLLQLRALASRQSFERHHCAVPALRAALDGHLGRRRFDLVSLEFPFLAHLPLRRAPPGSPPPLVVLDEHNIEHDLARQSLGASRGPLRRARALRPALRSAVVPNAVDVERFRPDPSLPPPDGQTVVFFGTLDYFPNLDGVSWFLAEIWPRLSQTHPRARLKLIGPRPTPELLRRRDPRLEVAGLVDDLRPHLSAASAVVVPLRLGGGTRFKIVEAMAMGKGIVSTTLGAEGITAVPGEHLLLADDPASFAAAVGALLDDPVRAARLGAKARALAEAAYSWRAAAGVYERFASGLVPRAAPARAAR